jgi:hypothetical protein
MAKKKVTVSCDVCFYSKHYGKDKVWCMQLPKHTVQMRNHWCGQYLDSTIANDLDLRKPYEKA